MPVMPDPPTMNLRLSLLQFAPALRDVAANANTIAGMLAPASTDLAVTPELSLTGYDLRDAAPALAQSEVSLPDFKQPVLLGGVTTANGGLVYNSAILAQARQSTVVHRKVYLPTYGMFDEGRYFARGDRVAPFAVQGWRMGVLICEDFWHPALTYLLAMQGMHALVVMAAAPGRGALTGGEDGAFFASSDSWERIARTTAQLYGIYVIVCNRSGVEAGITFAGESLVVAPDAQVVARASVHATRIDVELQLSEIQRARQPYAHLRDDDTGLVAAELQRINTHA
jgi:predicted amidohydrolase